MGSFTVRGGLELQGSALGEITWLTSDGGVNNTTKLPTAGVFGRGGGGMGNGGDSNQPFQDTAINGFGGAFLMGHAAGEETTYLDLTTARRRCEELGVQCTGVTWENSETWNAQGFPVGSFTVRGGMELLSSVIGEITWLKSGGGTDPTAALPVAAAYRRKDYYVNRNVRG